MDKWKDSELNKMKVNLNIFYYLNFTISIVNFVNTEKAQD